MALLALAAPTQLIADPQINNGVNITALGTGATALTGNIGFTVPWVPGLGFAFVIGVTAPGVTSLVAPASYLSSINLGISAATSATYLFGPIAQEWQNTSGLVQVNVTTVTTVSVYAFVVPGTQYSVGAVGAKHNPFERSPQAADF